MEPARRQGELNYLGRQDGPGMTLIVGPLTLMPEPAPFEVRRVAEVHSVFEKVRPLFRFMPVETFVKQLRKLR